MSLKDNACVHWVRENLLLILILFGVILGFVIGVLFNEKVQTSTNPPSRELAMYISFPGELFLRILNLFVLPLIASSVIVSLATLDKISSAKLGKRAAICFIATTFIAAVVGVIFAVVIKPGATETVQETGEENNSKAIHTILDLFR